MRSVHLVQEWQRLIKDVRAAVENKRPGVIDHQVLRGAESALELRAAFAGLGLDVKVLPHPDTFERWELRIRASWENTALPISGLRN